MIRRRSFRVFLSGLAMCLVAGSLRGERDPVLDGLLAGPPDDGSSPRIAPPRPPVAPAVPAQPQQPAPALRRSPANRPVAPSFAGLSHAAMVVRDWEYWDREAIAGGGYGAAATNALGLARRTLALAGGGRALAAFADDVAALARSVEAPGDEAAWRSRYLAIRALRRRMVFSHPLMRFEKLLAVKAGPPRYSHMCDQYLGRHSVAGEGLVILENWREDPFVRRVLPEGVLPPGSVHHPDLSYDGKRIVFAFCPHTEQDAVKRWFYLWEADVAGGTARQLTGVRGRDPMETQDGRNTVYVEDWDPCYLPGGDIAFISTRNQGFGRCHGGRYTPSYVLYRCRPDGTGIHRLSWGEANEWDPSVLHDGTVVFTRWDYINRHDCLFQSLWTTRPDGTATAHYYGNNTPVPNMILEARAIPGTTKVVATAGAHHSYTCGTLMIVDTLRGRDGLPPITRLTPDVPYPEQQPWAPTPGMHATYCNPWPLNEAIHLASFSPYPMAGQGRIQEVNAYGLYAVDLQGGRELIYRDPDMSAFSPIPLAPRPMPPALASSLPADAPPKGLFHLEDVYRSGRGEIAPGQAKYLRIVGILEQPEAGARERGRAANEVVKWIVGTVPIGADGSVAFLAPARESLLFQVLDKNHMSLMAMRSQVYVQPGEKAACVGCHESDGTTAPLRPRKPLVVCEITPPPGPRYEGGFSFARTVQPVLDRYCIRCHAAAGPSRPPPAPKGAIESAVRPGLTDADPLEAALDTLREDPKAGTAAAKTRPPGGGRTVNLLGSPTGFNAAYDALTQGDGLVRVAPRNGETWMSVPKDYGSHAGRLAAMLLDGHGGRVQMDPESFQRIAGWLDLNAQYTGDYTGRSSPEKAPHDPAAERALRLHVEVNCNRCHAGLSEQPYAALVNKAQPDESRVLRAILSCSAGGWGQCRNGFDSPQDGRYLELFRKVLAAAGGTTKTNPEAALAAAGRQADPAR